MDGEHVILTWSVENWVTVLLMVGIGFLVLKIGAQFLNRNSNAGVFS